MPFLYGVMLGDCVLAINSRFVKFRRPMIAGQRRLYLDLRTCVTCTAETMMRSTINARPLAVLLQLAELRAYSRTEMSTTEILQRAASAEGALEQWAYNGAALGLQWCSNTNSLRNSFIGILTQLGHCSWHCYCRLIVLVLSVNADSE